MILFTLASLSLRFYAGHFKGFRKSLVKGSMWLLQEFRNGFQGLLRLSGNSVGSGRLGFEQFWGLVLASMLSGLGCSDNLRAEGFRLAACVNAGVSQPNTCASGVLY